MKKLIVFLCLFAFLPSMVHAFAGPPPDRSLMLNMPKDKDNPVVISIEDIKNVPELEKQTVRLIGHFAGWENLGEPKPFSMHDWVLRNETGAIYIHGQYPDGCDPLDHGTYGTEIEIVGKIESKLVTNLGNVTRVVFIDYVP